MGADVTDPGLRGEAGISRDITDYPDLEVAQLDDLAQVLPLDRILGLAQSYYASASDMLTELDRAAAGTDWTRLRELAHDLKGTSGSFGASRLQRLAEMLEVCCAQQHGEVASALVLAMHRSLAAAWSAIEDRIAAMSHESTSG